MATVEAAVKNSRKKRVGRVVSDKMDKTVVVAVGIQKKHAFYPKFIRRTQKYKAHDEMNEAKTGDLVEITETRALSKNKRWRVSKIVEKAK